MKTSNSIQILNKNISTNENNSIGNNSHIKNIYGEKVNIKNLLNPNNDNTFTTIITYSHSPKSRTSSVVKPVPVRPVPLTTSQSSRLNREVIVIDSDSSDDLT